MSGYAISSLPLTLGATSAFTDPFPSGIGSTDPAIQGLDELGQSYSAEESFLQSELWPQTPSTSLDPATQLEQALAGDLTGGSSLTGLLFGGGGSDPASNLTQELLGGGGPVASADNRLLADGLPPLAYTSSGLLTDSGLFASSGPGLYA